MDEKSTKEKLDEIACRRAARRLVAGLGDDEAAELERAELIDAAEEKHGIVGQGIAVLEMPDNSIVIVKKPANATYRKFQDSKERAEDASKAFVKPCVVHPAAEVYTKLLEDYPGILPRLVKSCARLAGFQDEEKS